MAKKRAKKRQPSKKAAAPAGAAAPDLADGAITPDAPKKTKKGKAPGAAKKAKAPKATEKAKKPDAPKKAKKAKAPALADALAPAAADAPASATPDGPALHIMDGVFFNAAGTAFAGRLVHFGAAGSGRITLHSDQTPTGIYHRGVELRFARDPDDPAVLSGRTGDTDESAFVITASADGSYAFEQFASFDPIRLAQVLHLGSDAGGCLAGAGYEAGGKAAAFYLTENGTWDFTGDPSRHESRLVEVTAARAGGPGADVTRAGHGFGVANGLLDFQNSLNFTVNTTGARPCLVSAMRFSFSGLFRAHAGTPAEYLYCTIHYCDAAGNVLAGRSLSRQEIKGVNANRATPQYYDVPVPDGCFIASVAFNDAIKYYRACEINLAGITCFRADPGCPDYRIPDLRFAFTATDGEGGQASGQVGLAIDPQDLKHLYTGDLLPGHAGLVIHGRSDAGDSIAGGEGDNVIYPGGGDNTILTEGGNDTLAWRLADMRGGTTTIADAGKAHDADVGPQHGHVALRFDDLFETKDELELLLDMATWDGATRVFAEAGYENKAVSLDLQFLRDVGSALKVTARNKTGDVAHSQTVMLKDYDFTRRAQSRENAAELLQDIIKTDD
jgi:hypothetical protein